ncbi:SMC5-SMC6 complex localization factor protein 1 isoform X2 [Thalassophryne amazonica]|nr:SMC5-SMC6 complex localization factor protein 1 isoform X2 [Thalassophryne amazonica]
MVQDPSRRAMFTRLLTAGKAKVYHYPPRSHSSITHVMAKPLTEDSKSHSAPCYPVTHIIQHLFGSNSVTMNLHIKGSLLSETTENENVDLSYLQKELRDYIIKQEGRPRLVFLEFLSYSDPCSPEPQAMETEFINVDSMIQCGLFAEALDSIRGAVYPGLLPPAPYLSSLFGYAQQGSASSFFLTTLEQFLYQLLTANPPWQDPSKRFFAQVLQCPQCKAGLWPFLQTAISYCLSSEVTCHAHPQPALPTVKQFYMDLLAFCLKLFQGELHSTTTGLKDFLTPQGSELPPASASGLLLYRTFWTVSERSTLLSHALKRLIQHLVQAAREEYVEGYDRREMLLPDILLDLLSVLVEFWCQQYFKLNLNLMEKGLTDLAEHFAVISQDVCAVILKEVIIRISSPRLKMVMADAIFKNLCLRNGFTVTDEPLSLKKMVLSYLTALGSLTRSPTSASPKTNPASDISISEGTNSGNQTLLNDGSLGKKSIPRRLNRVNAAGETLLHRACKKNQVETVLQILALPGTDINVKDHAGWTPMHEACNHGSSACVHALLRHYPAPVLNSQVGGVSPLHDALLNGHMDIAKMLLEHAGSVLLQQTYKDGLTALDLVSSSHQREELLHSAHTGDSALLNQVPKVVNLPLLEVGSTLLAHLIFSYQKEKGLLGRTQPGEKAHEVASKLVRALETHSVDNVTASWTDQHAVRLVEDTDTLLGLGRGHYLGQVSEAVKAYKGENTTFLMKIMEDLKCQGEALLREVDKHNAERRT